jgi:hypothetical protein
MRRKDLDGAVLHLCSSPELAFTLEEIRKLAKPHFEAGAVALPPLRRVPSFAFRVASLGHHLLPESSKLKLRLRLLPQFLAYAAQDQAFENSRTRARFPGESWPRPADYMDRVIAYYCRTVRERSGD